MFGPITIPYEAVMLYNVCKLKEGIEWSDDLEFCHRRDVYYGQRNL